MGSTCTLGSARPPTASVSPVTSSSPTPNPIATFLMRIFIVYPETHQHPSRP